MSTGSVNTKTITSRGPEETIAFAASLVESLPPGSIIALDGDLGAGKTHFVQGLARGLGLDPTLVTSPTFTVVHEYGRPDLIHIDAYRVKSPAEMFELGIEDLLAGPWLVAIEWPDRLGPWLPEEAIRISIEHTGRSERLIRVQSQGAYAGGESP